MKDSASLVTILLIFLMPLLSIAAWITHVIVCIQTQAYLLLIAGGIVFPVGMIHGFGVWFGIW